MCGSVQMQNSHFPINASLQEKCDVKQNLGGSKALKSD